MCSACQAKAAAARYLSRSVNILTKPLESVEVEPCIYELSELIDILNTIKENIRLQNNVERNTEFLPYIQSQVNIYRKNCNKYVELINENIDLWE